MRRCRAPPARPRIQAAAPAHSARRLMRAHGVDRRDVPRFAHAPVSDPPHDDRVHVQRSTPKLNVLVGGASPR